MDETIRKWRKSHHRCRNCKYLCEKSVVDYECGVKGHTMREWEVFQTGAWFPRGTFCLSYKPKEDEKERGNSNEP